MIKKDELKSLQQGHRARLRQKFLDNQLSEYEILELLLTYAIPRRDVRVLARQLYKKYGNIRKLLAMSFEALMENDGVKENTAIFFKAIHKISELNYKSVLYDAPIFYDNDKLVRYCQSLVAEKSVEEFYVLYLDKQHKLIKTVLHSSGTIDWAAVYVREIVKKALDLNACSIVLLHNHPTPGVSFSSQDIDTTKSIENMLAPLGIKLYDHFLVSADILYSARNMNLLNKK
ncbi:MAG: RadC family protein [Alphaproteobacteria bacterium]|nr:RadC family protein [Alphaproteobacteria bacterium]